MDQTGVYNLTLGRLGIGQAVASPTENSVPAKTCNRFYEQCRQEVLRAFPWGFALRAEALAKVADQTFPGWGYVYQIPNKCLQVRGVTDAQGMRFASTLVSRYDTVAWPQITRQPWQIALKNDGASQVILTDVDAAWAFFTVDVTNSGAWPVDFGSVLAWRLGMEAGGPLQAKQEMIDRCEQRYAAWFSHAAAATMNEQRDDPKAESDSITVRY